jgi:hypothetical protein
MQAEPIRLRIDGHGAKPKFRARAKNADRDFTAVGSE